VAEESERGRGYEKKKRERERAIAGQSAEGKIK